MKKKICGLVLIVSVLCGLFAGCINLNKNANLGENFAKNATYTYNDGKVKKTIAFNGKNVGKAVKVTFTKAVEINTIIVGEKTDVVDSFELWIDVLTTVEEEGKQVEKMVPKLIYKQDEMGKNRYVYLNRITVKEITLRVFATNGEFCVNKFEAYNVEREQGAFRNTTYLVVNDFLNNETNREGLEHCTDIILFGQGQYNEKGELLTFKDNEKELLTNNEKITKSIEILKKLNNKPHIFVNFVLSSTIKNTNNIANEKFFASLQKIALKENKDKLVKNLKEYVANNGIDGIAFDYEYPYTADDYKVYGDFLIALKAAIPDKFISIAVAPWGLKFSKKAIAAVDMFELMTYDMPDKRGNHNGWKLGCIKSLEDMVKFGYPKSKINLGIAFYSRPIDYGNYWGSYNQEADKLSEFSNYVSEEFVTTNEWTNETFLVKGRWYNGVNIVQDKTAFAFDTGFGGIMSWHYACDVNYDNPRSLIRAIENVFDK